MQQELSRVRTSQHRSPIPTFPKGKERHKTTSNTARRNSHPLGRVAKGAYHPQWANHTCPIGANYPQWANRT